MNGAHLVTLTGRDVGDDDARSAPDDVFIGTSAAQRSSSQVPQLQIVSGVGSWVKENPVVAGALAVAAIYLIYRMSKRR